MPKQSKTSSAPIDALISLMGDPDPHVWPPVEKQLLKLGGETRDSLWKAAEGDDSSLVRMRAREVLAKIHAEGLTDSFRNWVDPGRPEHDLEEGWFLLTKLEFPGLDEGAYRRKLDEMAADLDPLLQGAGDLDALKVFQRYVHFEKEFRGNVQGYHEAENSYINGLLDRRLGIPISLSSLYLLISRRVGLPFEGISAPGHFLLRYRRDGAGKDPVYIDPFHGGRNLSRKECAAFIRSMGHVAGRELDTPVNNRHILARMCRNLAGIYGASGPAQKAERLIAWIDILGSAGPSNA